MDCYKSDYNIETKYFFSGNKIIVHEWWHGDEEHPEGYYWGEQVVEISDFSDSTFELNWGKTSDVRNCNQKIEMLANGVLKIFSTENYCDENNSYTYTDYFYNPDDENSYTPSLPGVGLYQEDPEFVNVVNVIDNPKEIVKYMEENVNFKELGAYHSPYQTYLSKEGQCIDYAVFSCAIAHYHGYECFIVVMNWWESSDLSHAITVYDMGDYYTYSSNYIYYDQKFNCIEDCINHCASTYVWYIEGELSSYSIYNWGCYYYRNFHLFNKGARSRGIQLQ